MVESIQTPGGTLHPSDIKYINDCICDVFGCRLDEITDLKPLNKGLCNSVLSFRYKGEKYTFRYPGMGSEVLVDRGRESFIQNMAGDAGVDTTVIAVSAKYGWRISRFVQTRPFQYHNEKDMMRAVLLLRKLHAVKPKVRWEFDLKEKWEYIRDMTPADKYGTYFIQFPDFAEVIARVNKLYELAKTDGIKKCLTHGDSRDDNFLINDQEIQLIDWEYAGYGDPGFDLGSYICGGDHSIEEIDGILFAYYGRKPSLTERRHLYAYIAITGFFFFYTVIYKESQGQDVGALKSRWYHYAREYSQIALPLYDE